MVTNNGAQVNIFPAVNGTATTTQEHQDTCGRCGYGGSDVRVSPCGCTLHARCTPVSMNSRQVNCPMCQSQSSVLLLLPMSFHEMDEACKAAAALSASGKRGKKRKSATIARLNPEVSAVDDNTNSSGNDASDLRTGRWTHEETLYCDQLIAKFEDGELPLVDGIKLNDFLAKMLKSKQSRLTKKMKNAKLSSRTFVRRAGYILDSAQTTKFSELEDSFIRSIPCSMERAEIRFHMQKEWREQFSSFCVAVGQQMNADSWLSSVEEVDRRTSQAKDAARMARRKMMMGYALERDIVNPNQGVFIERSGVPTGASLSPSQTDPSNKGEEEDFMNIFSKPDGNAAHAHKLNRPKPPFSPFLAKVAAYLQRNRVPFEHVDAWVPSFVPPSTEGATASSGPTCRLCFGGYVSVESKLVQGQRASAQLSSEEHFDFLAFGEYSQKFSFNVGCGLPGRVYQTGVSSWEQNVQNAPGNHFERCGGAVQWGIKTVLGMPIPSPNVGRIVVVLYSRHDRPKDQEMVSRLCDDFTKMLPAPKWKLVVDIGAPLGNAGSETSPGKTTSQTSTPEDNRVNEIVALMDAHMPADSKSPAAPYLPGFTSLKLMLAKPSKSPTESDILKSLLDSYSSYASAGRTQNDIALMLARDYMFLYQQQSLQKRQQPLLPRSDTQTASVLTNGYTVAPPLAQPKQQSQPPVQSQPPAQSQPQYLLAPAPAQRTPQNVQFHSFPSTPSAHPAIPTQCHSHVAQGGLL